MEDIKSSIPHRDPFLFVRKILDRTDNSITTSTTFESQYKFFEGHFPDNPIVPGVLLCEAVFQSGAILMDGKDKTPIVTRIQNTKFKNFLKPDEHVNIHVEIIESLENAFHLKGKISRDSTTILTINFSCALV